MKDNPCVRKSHIVDGKWVLVPKKKYKTEKEALEKCRYYNERNADHLIYKFMVYKCPKCGFWHIGHNNIPLSDKNREKLLKRKVKN